MEKAELLEEKELLDALVVDSEGYICGRIESVDFKTDRILINLHDTERMQSEVPDIEALTRTLILLVPKKKGFFGGKPTVNDLHKQIRNELGLGPSAPILAETLVDYAKQKDISIPTKSVEREERIKKGSIVWTAVEKIGASDGSFCLLLKEPLEAKKRGIEIARSIPFQGTDFLKGRIIIDSEARIIGSVVKLLVATDASLGIMVRKESVSKMESVDVDALVNALVPSNFKTLRDLYTRVGEDVNLRGRITISDVRKKFLVLWAEGKGIQVPRKKEITKEIEFEFYVKWSDIRKIGDVIILNKSMEALTEKKPAKEEEKVEVEAKEEKEEEEEKRRGK